MENEFYFLGERITKPNPETDYFLVDSDPTFIEHIQEQDLEGDKILLRFSQRIWEMNNESQKFMMPYYSKFYSSLEDTLPFHIHDIFYHEYLKEKATLQTQILCLPTLSFRTLIYNSSNHIKFGLPLRYGRFLRTNPKEEVLSALYLSDYIQELPKIESLDFFTEFKGYSFSNIEEYSVSYRRLSGSKNLEPIGCYFNRILNHSDATAQIRFDKALNFVEHLTQDFNNILPHLYQHGLGLEVHGQNLLVEVDATGEAQRKYVYRDLGSCTICPSIQKKQVDLNKYYKSSYNFKLPTKHLRPPHYRAWMSFRIFFLGFLIYNLNRFAQQEKIDTNVYFWYEKLISDIPHIKSIY